MVACYFIPQNEEISLMNVAKKDLQLKGKGTSSSEILQNHHYQRATNQVLVP